MMSLLLSVTNLLKLNGADFSTVPGDAGTGMEGVVPSPFDLHGQLLPVHLHSFFVKSMFGFATSDRAFFVSLACVLKSSSSNAADCPCWSTMAFSTAATMDFVTFGSSFGMGLNPCLMIQAFSWSAGTCSTTDRKYLSFTCMGVWEVI